MSLYINYEAAQNRFDCADLFSARVLATIHRAMLQNAYSVTPPAYPFDVCYYYDSLVRSLATDYGHRLQGFDTCSPNVRAVNAPLLATAEWQEKPFVKRGNAQSYADLVARESRPEGRPFDLGFGCRIAAEAFDEDALAFIGSGAGKGIEAPGDSFDEWLAGFTTPAEES